MRLFIRLLIVIVSVIISGLVYSYYYNIDEADLNNSINQLFEAEVIIQEKKAISNNLYNIKDGFTIQYSYDKFYNHYEGIVIFEKGFNEKYRLVQYDNKRDKSVVYFNTYKRDNKEYIQLYGELSSVEEIIFYTTEEKTLIIDVTQYDYADEVEVDFKLDEIEYYVVTTDKYSKQYGVIEEEITYVFKGEKVLVYSACGFVMMFGFMTFSMFSKETNVLESIFNRITRIKSSK
jgi:hypothetical protein